jgi:hypothetical protein
VRRKSYLPPSRHSPDQYVGVFVLRCGYIYVAYSIASACTSATDAPSLFATNQIDCMP